MPQPNWLTVNTAIATRNTRRRPKRSLNQPTEAVEAALPTR